MSNSSEKNVNKFGGITYIFVYLEFSGEVWNYIVRFFTFSKCNFLIVYLLKNQIHYFLLVFKFFILISVSYIYYVAIVMAYNIISFCVGRLGLNVCHCVRGICIYYKTLNGLNGLRDCTTRIVKSRKLVCFYIGSVFTNENRDKIKMIYRCFKFFV